MKVRHAVCPKCKSILAVPPGCCDCHVRCGQCRSRFRLPRRIRTTEDAIASWLMEEEGHPSHTPEGDAVLEGIDRPSEQEEFDEAIRQSPAAVQGDTRIAPAISTVEDSTHQVRLVRLTNHSALFEFPASRLEDPRFRCAMPRECLSCNTRSHLKAHVIIYTPELRDSLSLEEEYQAGGMVLSDAEVRGLTGEQVLARLPRVPNVPYPGSLPMPYWICDMCSGQNAVRAQINVNSETGQGWCQLQIRNLTASEAFIVAAGGSGTPGHESLKRKLEAREEQPWVNLPEAVRHRIEQWFKPQRGEQFFGYSPDRDRSRTEDGVSGLVVTSERLIYHTNYRHEECDVHEAFKLTLSMSGPRGELGIRAPHWEVKRIRLDRDGVKRLRRSLYLARSHAVWR